MKTECHTLISTWNVSSYYYIIYIYILYILLLLLYIVHVLYCIHTIAPWFIRVVWCGLGSETEVEEGNRWHRRTLAVMMRWSKAEEKMEKEVREVVSGRRK